MTIALPYYWPRGKRMSASLKNNRFRGSPNPDYWDRIYIEGKDLLMNLLDIPVPVIGAVNGPAFIHAELVTMSDIVIASDTAIFADLAHFPGGTVPSDGVHVWWEMLLG